MPGRALDHVLFPNCPRFPELDNLQLPESDAGRTESAGPSEVSLASEVPVVAPQTTDDPAAKATAVKTVQWSSDPLPAQSSTTIPKEDKKWAPLQPAIKKRSPVKSKKRPSIFNKKSSSVESKKTTSVENQKTSSIENKKSSPFENKKSSPFEKKKSLPVTTTESADLKSEESSEDRDDESEDSLEKTDVPFHGATESSSETDHPESSSQMRKGLKEEQKNVPPAVFGFVSVLIVFFLVIVAILVFPRDSDRHHDAHDTEPLPPVGDIGRKKGRSGADEAKKEEEATDDVVTALPRTTSTRERPFSLAGYGDASAPDGDATSVECDTESCRWESRLVNDMLNVTVDPCEDFYAYVCSSAWERSSDDLPYRAAGRAFLINEVTRYLQEHAHSLPSAVTKDISHGEHNFLDHSSIVLSGCLKNAVPKDVHQWDGIRGLLRDVGLGDWPYVRPPAQPFQLERVLSLIDRQMAVFPVVYVFLRKLSDDGNYILHLDAPRNFLFVQYTMQKTDVSLHYKEIVRQVLTLWKALPRSEALAEDIARFEAQLAEASKPVSKPLWKKDPVFRVREFPRLPNFHVDVYLSHLRKRHADDVVVLNEAYVRNLSTILLKPTPRTIVNFLGFSVIAHVAPFLPEESIPGELLRMGYPSFQHRVDPRVQGCFHLVSRLYPHGIRWILRDILVKTPDQDRQLAVTTKNMVSSLAHTFREGTVFMRSLDVTDAVKRLKTLEVGYLAGHEREEQLDQYYAPANLTYGPEDPVRYYGELLASSLHRYWRSSKGESNYDARHETRTSDLEAAWTRAPESTSGVYLTSSGVSSAALVTRSAYPSTMFPLLAADVTRALFTCSLDDPEWSSWTRDQFDELQYCLLRRYKSDVRRVRVSTRNIRYFLAEILADNAAVEPLMAAFQRFSDGTTHFGPDGRRFSRRTLWRLFFVNYAAGFCVPGSEAAQLDERMRHRLSMPPNVRVNLALMDVREFRDAFKCSREYASPQCPVWKRKDNGRGENSDPA
ncbi:hypothetical protein MTO96_004419 [Rhipicephalus appendiculatus]